MKILKDKTITDISGFKAAGIHCGIKKSGKKDLCILYSETPCQAAAAFTLNTVKAAPILVNMEHIQSEYTQAIVVNSGNANACTGYEGLENAKLIAKTAAEQLDIPLESVLVGSTGIIGVPMPMSVVISGIKTACTMLSTDGGNAAAEAIMTTDSFTKKMTVEIQIDDKPVLISGFAKGSGMIHPNMGTMLSFIATNVNITKELLEKAMNDSVEDTYNMVSIDGDTSTNDMAVIMANGTAENNIIDDINEDYQIFKKALDFINQELAKMIAKDGEGATKLIEVTLINAKTLKDAKLCAKSVISSNLVKSAFFGCDANWGRIMCSLGYASGDFAPDKVDIYFENKMGSLQLVKDGIGIPFSEELALKILKQDYINIHIDLKDGSYNAMAWGCDLSYDYIKINGSYRS